MIHPFNELRRKIAHLCEDCFEVNTDFFVSEEGRKVCSNCGGRVLYLQEAADRIADLKAELRHYKDDEYE